MNTIVNVTGTLTGSGIHDSEVCVCPWCGASNWMLWRKSSHICYKETASVKSVKINTVMSLDFNAKLVKAEQTSTFVTNNRTREQYQTDRYQWHFHFAMLLPSCMARSTLVRTCCSFSTCLLLYFFDLSPPFFPFRAFQLHWGLWMG